MCFLYLKCPGPVKNDFIGTFNFMTILQCICVFHTLNGNVSMCADSEIKGDVLFLGNYESEFDWANETAKVRKVAEFSIILSYVDLCYYIK